MKRKKNIHVFMAFQFYRGQSQVAAIKAALKQQTLNEKLTTKSRELIRKDCYNRKKPVLQQHNQDH